MARKEFEIARKSPKTSCFEILRFESKLLTSPIVYLCSEYIIRQNGKRAVGSRFLGNLIFDILINFAKIKKENAI